jgi:tetratricopeptide (TPR) repeat protein
MPGVGKTQTALEYAYRHREAYKAVFWCQAQTREALVTDFAAVAVLLNLCEKDEKDQNLIATAAKRWLEQNAGWLLILDNADDIPMVREFIPANEDGNVLLTTRAMTTGRIALRNAVEKMEVREGAFFLLRHLRMLKEGEPLESSPTDLLQQAQDLSKVLDGLPLALDQAAAYIEETPSTLEKYLSLYQSERTRLLALRGELTDGHPESVAVTFSLAFQKVSEKKPAAADLLQVCALLEADAIPEEIFSKGAKELGEALSNLAASAVDMDEAIKEAGRFSLLQYNPDARMMSLHRLVQAVLKDEMDSDARRMWAERAVRAVNEVFPKVEYTTWPSCSRLISHAQRLASLIDEYGCDFPEAARLMNQAGDYLDERAQYAEAEPLFRCALAIREKALGIEHPDVAVTLNNLAWLYYNQGRYAEAKPLYHRALAIREKVFGSEHPGVADSLHNLGVLYFKQSKYAKAEPLYYRALAIREKALDAEHPDIAHSLNNLAGLYNNQGKYTEAEPLYHRALAIREKTLGAEHPDIALSLHNLAVLYDNQGKQEEAEPLYHRALAIWEKALGPEHPDVVDSLHCLAWLYKNRGKYADAELLLMRALVILEKVLGAEHPDVVTVIESYALILRKMDRSTEAEKLETRAATIRAKHSSPTY